MPKKSNDTMTASGPTKRDVLIGAPDDSGSAQHKGNRLVEDLIFVQKILWVLQGKDVPQDESDLEQAADDVIAVVRDGQLYEMAGLREVPHPFFKTPGAFFQKDGESCGIASDDEVKKYITGKLMKAFTDEDNEGSKVNPDESPFKELKDFIDTQSTSEIIPGVPEAKDVVLFRCNDSTYQKMYDNHSANKTIFNLASQLVTHQSSSALHRVQAALVMLKALNESHVQDEKTGEFSSKPTQYLVRNIQDEENANWKKLTSEEAFQFTVIFALEVFLEKEIHMTPDTPSALLYSADIPMLPPGTEGIDEPTEYDVLFGRGGFTNCHYGNRRFRDIIALHRPDYIRAIKMEKPNVARKIVNGIRTGDNPGRFLKKNEDGKWYDVGDRNACEKTSQGLRERTNAEKRQRSALREALRIRKEDLTEEEDGEGKPKRARTSGSEVAAAAAATTAPILNYIGANLSLPLSLGMKEIPKITVQRSKMKGGSGLQTAGLPPNAVDEDGNILVTDHDILLGRGGLTNHHLGNKRFRDVVALHRPDYVRAPKIQKPSVARVIVRAIRNGDPPGRFLRKDEKTGKWYDVGDKKAAEKTSQALREKSNEERDKVKRESGALSAALLPNYNSLMDAEVSAAAAAAAVAAAVGATASEDRSSDIEQEEANASEPISQESIEI